MASTSKAGSRRSGFNSVADFSRIDSSSFSRPESSAASTGDLIPARSASSPSSSFRVRWIPASFHRDVASPSRFIANRM